MVNDKDGDYHNEEAAHHAEMRAINEKLILASVRQHELAEIAFKSGELYRQLARNFPNGMVLLFDHDLRHLLADGTGLAPLCLSKESIEGKTIWEAFSPQTCQQMEPAYQAALSGETVVLEVVFHAQGPFSQEVTECQERVHQVHVLPVHDEAGSIIAGMAMTQDITERQQAETTIRWQAHHDALTGLPNRALLRDRLAQVLAISERSGEFAALLFVDIDCFKKINDTLGHDAGDRVLQVAAGRLTEGLRTEDTVARMGGDEFLVLLPSLKTPQDAAIVAQKITALFIPPVLLDKNEVVVTASIGVSLFPDDGRDAESLLRNADAAMYQSKRRQPGGYCLYSEVAQARPTPKEINVR